MQGGNEGVQAVSRRGFALAFLGPRCVADRGPPQRVRGARRVWSLEGAGAIEREGRRGRAKRRVIAWVCACSDIPRYQPTRMRTCTQDSRCLRASASWRARRSPSSQRSMAALLAWSRSTPCAGTAGLRWEEKVWEGEVVAAAAEQWGGARRQRHAYCVRRASRSGTVRMSASRNIGK